jgi:CBS domain-containing protein
LTTPNERLDQVVLALGEGRAPETLTVRQFLDWFGAKRRGYSIVRRIRVALRRRRLVTVPDFESAYIDGLIQFGPSLRSQGAGGSNQPGGAPVRVHEQANAPSEEVAEALDRVGGAIADPTFRLGRLAAANSAPIAVKPDASLDEATTLMLTHGFSQLPVMQNERDVKGIVSWRSIGARRSLALDCTHVRHCTDPHAEANSEQSLFSVIAQIVENDYVLVRGPDKRIQGIVTASDLSIQFRQLAEPFLLIGEIENYLRRLIDGKFTKEELRSVREEKDPREIETVADLTFGQHVRLLSDPKTWERVGLRVDRGVFIKRIDEVRQLRNDVMHFDPDPFAPEDLAGC